MYLIWKCDKAEQAWEKWNVFYDDKMNIAWSMCFKKEFNMHRTELMHFMHSILCNTHNIIIYPVIPNISRDSSDFNISCKIQKMRICILCTGIVQKTVLLKTTYLKTNRHNMDNVFSLQVIVDLYLTASFELNAPDYAKAASKLCISFSRNTKTRMLLQFKNIWKFAI